MSQTCCLKSAKLATRNHRADFRIYPIKLTIPIEASKANQQLPKTTELRQVKYLNNQVEQDHRFIKRLTKPGMGYRTTAGEVFE
ncbi:hypothetical protein B7486_49215 [cyanobacterium TDX16]|nr:hypothetical protein B7486_49215 [cyanobacterium TDX16]